MPGLASRQGFPHVALVQGRLVRQAEWHANVAVRRALAPAHLRRPVQLLICDSVESWDVDADAQSVAQAWDDNCTWRCRAALAPHCPWYMQVFDGLVDELLSTWRFAPCALFAETCAEARLQMVPELLPHGVGQV